MKTDRQIVWLLALIPFLTIGKPTLIQGQAEFGARVRVRTDSSSKLVVGTLIGADADSLRLTTAKDARAMMVPTRSVVRFERSLGLKTATGHGAGVGALVGVLTGLFLGVAASTDNSGWWDIGGEEIATAGVVVGLAGAGVGALIGSMSHRERWEPVPIPGRPAAGSRHKPSTIMIALRF
jgi:hypothetical protein